MKTKLNLFIAIAGTFAALALSSCTTNVNPTVPSTGATATTTTQQEYPYAGTSSTTRKTTTVQY